MKLRNLIFALFLAIGAIGFTACTGDDGEQGPPGPPGEQGPPGDSGGEGAGDVESSYAFLTNWGAASGMTSCSSDVLTGAGVFPGPAELDMIVNATTGQPAPVRVNAVCAADGAGGLVGTDPDLNGDGVADGTSINGLVFNITHMGAEDAVNTPVPGQGDANPRVMSVRKNFSGGTVHAQLPATGISSESFSRALLHHNCGVGTPPPAIAGEFRAVRIIETDTVLGVSEEGATEGTYVPLTATAITTTTHKVCVTLDSLPGVVKCFASVTVAGVRAGTAAGTTETVGIYRDAALHAVAPMPVAPATALTAVAGAGTDNLGILNLDEPVVAADGTITAPDGAIDDDVVQGKVCNLFLETRDQS